MKKRLYALGLLALLQSDIPPAFSSAPMNDWKTLDREATSLYRAGDLDAALRRRKKPRRRRKDRGKRPSGRRSEPQPLRFSITDRGATTRRRQNDSGIILPAIRDTSPDFFLSKLVRIDLYFHPQLSRTKSQIRGLYKRFRAVE